MDQGFYGTILFADGLLRLLPSSLRLAGDTIASLGGLLVHCLLEFILGVRIAVALLNAGVGQAPSKLEQIGEDYWSLNQNYVLPPDVWV